MIAKSLRKNLVARVIAVAAICIVAKCAKAFYEADLKRYQYEKPSRNDKIRNAILCATDGRIVEMDFDKLREKLMRQSNDPFWLPPQMGRN